MLGVFPNTQLSATAVTSDCCFQFHQSVVGLKGNSGILSELFHNSKQRLYLSFKQKAPSLMSELIGIAHRQQREHRLQQLFSRLVMLMNTSVSFQNQ